MKTTMLETLENRTLLSVTAFPSGASAANYNPYVTVDYVEAVNTSTKDADGDVRLVANPKQVSYPYTFNVDYFR